MTCYEYATLPVGAVHDITRRPIEADSFLAMDEMTRAYFDLVHAGFRWIRSDGDVAVFEKTWEGVMPARITQMLDENDKKGTKTE